MHSIDLVLDCREDKQYAKTVPDEVTTIDYRFVGMRQAGLEPVDSRFEDPHSNNQREISRSEGSEMVDGSPRQYAWRGSARSAKGGQHGGGAQHYIGLGARCVK